MNTILSMLRMSLGNFGSGSTASVRNICRLVYESRGLLHNVEALRGDAGSGNATQISFWGEHPEIEGGARMAVRVESEASDYG